MAAFTENEFGDPGFAHTSSTEMWLLFKMLLLRLEAYVQIKELIKFSATHDINRSLPSMSLHVTVLETNRKIPQLPRSKRQMTVKNQERKQPQITSLKQWFKIQELLFPTYLFLSNQKIKQVCLWKLRYCIRFVKSGSLAYSTFSLESAGYIC